MRGLFEISLKQGLATIASRMLTLCKCVDHRQWFFEHPLRQFVGSTLSPEILNKLEAKKADVARLRDMSQEEIGGEYYCSASPAMSGGCVNGNLCSLYISLVFKAIDFCVFFFRSPH